MDFLDAYAVRARLFPAILAITPALALGLLAARWENPGLPEVLTGIAVAVLFFAVADLARRMGRQKEWQLFKLTDGRPANRELSYTETTFDADTKARYRNFIAGKLGKTPPTQEQEIENPSSADSFYSQCFVWLRENTRDSDKFRILFNENVSCGFRRNLLGLKPFGIAVNLITVAIAAAIVWYEPDFASLTMGKIIVLGLLAFLHACFFIFGVTRAAVIDASKTYVRQLVLSCETLIADAEA